MLINSDGYTLVELLVSVSIVGILGAVAVPVCSCYYAECSMKLTISEIASMVREARRLALTSGEHRAVCFNTVTNKISLVLDRGTDGKWNTVDDINTRSFTLTGKGSGLNFGFGSCGPIPGLAAEVDGVSFQTNNSFVCNPDLSSNAGTVYLTPAAGRAMAITVSSNNEGYKIRTCRSGTWSQ